MSFLEIFLTTLRILTPQEWRHFEDLYTPAIQVHKPFHSRVQPGILREKCLRFGKVGVCLVEEALLSDANHLTLRMQKLKNHLDDIITLWP